MAAKIHFGYERKRCHILITLSLEKLILWYFRIQRVTCVIKCFYLLMEVFHYWYGSLVGWCRDMRLMKRKISCYCVKSDLNFGVKIWLSAKIEAMFATKMSSTCLFHIINQVLLSYLLVNMIFIIHPQDPLLLVCAGGL